MTNLKTRGWVLTSSHSPSVKKPSQAMRAALSERQLG